VHDLANQLSPPPFHEAEQIIDSLPQRKNLLLSWKRPG
jgi:hypothetical protein